MSELSVIRTFDDGSVLIQDDYGDTAVMTKEEYEDYVKSLEI